jgi:hypothetical protein
MTFEKLQKVSGDDTMSRTTTYEWYRRPQKARQVRSNVKVMLIIFFDYEGVVHHEFVQGQAVNKEFYVEVLRRLRESIRKTRPPSWKVKQWLLHHDNAPAHSSLVWDFLTKTDTSHSTTTLFAGSGTCRPFPVPQTKIDLERTKICHHRGDKRKFAEGPEGDTETSIPGLLPKLEEMGAVHW